MRRNVWKVYVTFGLLSATFLLGARRLVNRGKQDHIPRFWYKRHAGPVRGRIFRIFQRYPPNCGLRRASCYEHLNAFIGSSVSEVTDGN
jgi:hypothetical protein